MSGRPAPEARRAELAAGLAQVQERIRRSCAAVRRDPEEVTLIVVTKFFPAADVTLLNDLGVAHVGENRHQEAVAKRAQCAELPLTWHYIGHLQSNKAAAVGEWADAVHSVDRPKLVTALGRAAWERGRDLDVLVQVSLDERTAGEGTGRSGVAPEDALALGRAVAETRGLVLRGVMGVAPLAGDAAKAFERLAKVGGRLRTEAGSAGWMSAGMSGDLEEAVAAGATHVRVGSAVLGNRPAPG